VNYTLVGAFVLTLTSVAIAAALWLASGGAFTRQFDPYLAILDESVAGLNLNAPVKFNGVDVGQVRSIDLDPANPARVRLVFDIAHGTPIKVDTLAVLKTQGLTGIAYVELSGGSPSSANLVAAAGALYPEIRTKPSLSARLENVLTSVLAKLDQTSSTIDAVLSEENRKALSSTLANVAQLSQTLADRSATIDAGIQSAARTFDNSARLTAELRTQIGPTLDKVSRAADALEKLGNAGTLASMNAGKTVEAVGSDVQRFTADTGPELQKLMAELTVLSASLRRLTEQTERAPNSLLFGRSPAPMGPGETANPGARQP